MELKTNQIFLRNRWLPISIQLTLVVAATLLQGCASSNVSRNAASEFHATVQGPTSAYNGSGTNSLAESYQSTSQTTKGALIGGATGAIAGGVASGGAGILPGAAGGAIFGGALGAYIDANTTVADQLINRGNQVIVLGDQVLIVLPSEHLFNDETPVLRPYAYPTLNLVAHLISGYPNMTVKVTAYTESFGSERIYRSLSQQQANAIIRYLVRYGVNTRMLYAEGGGGTKPIVKPNPDSMVSDNNRVEITFEKLPV
ncbi:MAG: OmpA family protein [Gammaproteobacteria bacterium]